MILDVKNLKKSFGGIRALDCSFQVKEKTTTALIGPNGAGKTTLFNICTGLYKADMGRVYFKGKSILDLRPDQITNLGISRTFQRSRLFPKMTVLENILLARKNQQAETIFHSVFEMSREEQKKNKARALELLDVVHMKKFSDKLACNLSYGQSKLVEIARALATEPDLLLLDEPMAGLNPLMVEKMINVILDLKTRGKSILIIEHDLRFVFRISDFIIVLDQGKKLFSGTPDVVRNNESVIQAYLGDCNA